MHDVLRIQRPIRPILTLKRATAGDYGPAFQLSRRSGAVVQMILNRGPISYTSLTVEEATTQVAAVPISGGRLVRTTEAGVAYYDHAELSHAYTLLGVSLNGADTGGEVRVQTRGVVTHIGWGLTPGLIYMAGTNGFLIPASDSGGAFSQLVGRATDSNTLIFSPQTIYNNA